MLNSNFIFCKNIYFKRIYSIRNSVVAYSLASFIDILIILKISSLFAEISENNFQRNIIIYIFQCLFFILCRTTIVFILRKYSFNKIFKKKLEDEEYIVRNFVNKRIRNLNDNDLNQFKEKLISSSNLAVVNFDIPIISIIAELIFAIGGVVILLNIFGVKLFLFNLPVFISLLIFSKLVSKKLKNFGNEILSRTEKRLNVIDNVSEIAFEISSLNSSDKLIDYFGKQNKPYNKVLGLQIITSNMMQIITESCAFIIILISLVSLIINITEANLANSATSLAVLSRMVPSFTRTISFITQLQFGTPCVKRLSKIHEL